MDLAGLGGVAAILRLAKKIAEYVSRLSDLERAPQEINEFKISCSNFGNILNGFYRVSDKCVKKEEKGGEKIWSEKVAGFILQGRQVDEEMSSLLKRLEGSGGDGMKWWDHFLWNVFRKDPVRHLKLNMGTACIYMQSFVALFTLDELQLQWDQCDCATEKRRLKREIKSLKLQIETQSVVAEQSARDLRNMNKRLPFNEQEQKENRFIRRSARGLDRSLQRRLDRSDHRSQATSRSSNSDQSSELSPRPHQVDHQQIRITRTARPQPRWHDADVDGFAKELDRDPYKDEESLRPGSNSRHDLGAHIDTDIPREREDNRGTRIHKRGQSDLWPPASAIDDGPGTEVEEFVEEKKDFAHLNQVSPDQARRPVRRGSKIQVGSRVIDDGRGLRVERGQRSKKIQREDDHETDSEEAMNSPTDLRNEGSRQTEAKPHEGNNRLRQNYVREGDLVLTNPKDGVEPRSPRQSTTQHHTGQASNFQAEGNVNDHLDRNSSARPRTGDETLASCATNHENSLPNKIPSQSKNSSRPEINGSKLSERGQSYPQSENAVRTTRVPPEDEKHSQAHKHTISEARANWYSAKADYKRSKNLKPVAEKRKRDGQGVVTGDPEEDDEFERRKRWGRGR
ncbi:hypothetical protein E2P81_ATG05424 [Venturia nashicola]|uniref:Uncharacterized protein n=1 Tax=Venturia nashicola TaxID=86259 RepID=A0A4Z1NZT0_9PEZI|nr:hypothetical protein E6O75_ATG05559 [Venturia nashicola]TLD32448.1 hypothetical protein E2P81_ATG05424 [Venturia nashicola]